jgi:DNA adenine methylase
MSTRPPFAYYGGKTMLADKIVELLPPHEHYVEPFAGSLAVLLAKPRSAMETVNDLDQDLVTFWRVLRDRPDDLERAMLLTPHSRAEQQASYDLDTPDELERARRVWVLLSQGRGGTMRRTGWRFYRNPGGSTYSMPDYLAAYADRVPPCARRIHGVSLECRPALDVIADYGKHPDVLLYCDPPYVAATRNSAAYRYEMGDLGEHRELAAALRECKASVVLSGYASQLYLDLYEGWHQVELTAWTGNGILGEKTRTDGFRTEILWSNRPLGPQASLFDDLTSEVPA